MVRDGWTRLGRSPEDGGSFSGAELRREISLILYLDDPWEAEWGGQLRVYPAAGEPVDVQPDPAANSVSTELKAGEFQCRTTRRYEAVLVLAKIC